MVPYCSVACYKLHKQNPCIKPPSPPKQTISVKQAVENLYPTEDTVPLDRLNLLENSTEVKKCLENPHVREILELLDSSANPDARSRQKHQVCKTSNASNLSTTQFLKQAHTFQSVLQKLQFTL